MTATFHYSLIPLSGITYARSPVVSAAFYLDGQRVCEGVGQTEEMARLAAVNDYCADVRRAVEAEVRAERAARRLVRVAM